MGHHRWVTIAKWFTLGGRGRGFEIDVVSRLGRCVGTRPRSAWKIREAERESSVLWILLRHNGSSEQALGVGNGL